LKKKSDEDKLKNKADKKLKLAECIKRGEKWYKFDLAEKKALIENKRQAKKSGNYYVPAEAKVAFVVRIKG
jgi:large subunit ribosomal protein L7e